MTDLEARLRKAMKATDWPILKLSREAKIGYASAHRFCKGEPVSLDVAGRIAAALGLELRPARRGQRKG